MWYGRQTGRQAGGQAGRRAGGQAGWSRRVGHSEVLSNLCKLDCKSHKRYAHRGADHTAAPRGMRQQATSTAETQRRAALLTTLPGTASTCRGLPSRNWKTPPWKSLPALFR